MALSKAGALQRLLHSSRLLLRNPGRPLQRFALETLLGEGFSARSRSFPRDDGLGRYPTGDTHPHPHRRTSEAAGRAIGRKPAAAPAGNVTCEVGGRVKADTLF